MNQEKVNKVLDLIIVGLEKGGEFATTQVGVMSQEILNFKFYTSLCILIFLFLSSLGALALWIYAVNNSKPDCKDSQDGILLSFLLFIALIFFQAVPIHSMFKIKYAPTSYVIEYLKGMS